MNLVIQKQESHIQIIDNDNNNILFVCSYDATANPNYTDFKTVDIVDNNSIETFKIPFDNATIYYQIDLLNPPVLYSGTFENFILFLNNDFFTNTGEKILEHLQKEIKIYQEYKVAPTTYELSDFLDVSFAVTNGTVDVTIDGITINYPVNAHGSKILGADYTKENTSNSITFNGAGEVLITYTKDR